MVSTVKMNTKGTKFLKGGEMTIAGFVKPQRRGKVQKNVRNALITEKLECVVSSTSTGQWSVPMKKECRHRKRLLAKRVGENTRTR